MAFNQANWANGGTAINAPAIHRYITADTMATVNTSGYFNSVYNEVKLNDCILVVADTAGTPQHYLARIATRAAAVVDVTDGLAGGTTNTD